VPGSASAQNEAAGAMRSLATTLIADATAGGGNPAQITQALTKVANGDADRISGDYAGAIAQYRLGWNNAGNALH